MHKVEELEQKLLSELKEIAGAIGLTKYKSLSKSDLVKKIIDFTAQEEVKEDKEEKKEAAPAAETVPEPPVRKKRARIRRENVTGAF